ncbi:MAG: DUF2283 domain-containing protein [Planctomycetota bacterium]|nr:MAG: DUF2283 domain-containing protein [Planctomycetota bacterium]
MKSSYDKKVDAAYIQISTEIIFGGVAKTYPCDPIEVCGQINLDFDHEGRLVGIEILDASKKLPPEFFREIDGTTRG